MAKSPDAFRTISEVADWLGIQAHVLRFWESKFTQVKPIKRAGGRRYYRPADMLLLGGIKQLLHEDGLTIKGVQKILREEGMGHVASLSPPLDELTLSELDDAPEEAKVAEAAPVPEEKGVVLNFDSATEQKDIKSDTQPVEKLEISEDPAPVEDPPKPAVIASDQDVESAAEDPTEEVVKVQPTQAEPEETSAESVEAQSEDDASTDEPEPVAKAAEAPEEEPAKDTAGTLPAFLRRPLADTDTPAEEDAAEPEPETPEPEPEAAAPAPKPRILDLPPFTEVKSFPTKPAALTAAYRAKKPDADTAREIRSLLEKLIAQRDQMSAQRRQPAPPTAKD